MDGSYANLPEISRLAKFYGASVMVDDCHATGFVGTPHYVFYDHQRDRTLGLFGREHLALIRSKLSEQGLARNEDVKAEFSHAWRGPAKD